MKKNPLRAVQKKKENADTAVSNLAERLDRFKISDAQIAEIRSLEQGVVNAKCAHSDLQRSITEAVERQKQLHVAVEQHFKMFNDRVGSLAREYGINPDDPSKGRWDFNSATGVFTKVPT